MPHPPPHRRLDLPEANVVLGGLTYQTAVLDFGPPSIDGWLTAMVGAEPGVAAPAPKASVKRNRHLTRA
jgi:hypothetical protein